MLAPVSAKVSRADVPAASKNGHLYGNGIWRFTWHRQMAPRKEELQSESEAYMQTIKAKHQEEEVNRRDRKARRRQALAQHQTNLQVMLASLALVKPITAAYRPCARFWSTAVAYSISTFVSPWVFCLSPPLCCTLVPVVYLACTTQICCAAAASIWH